MKEKIKDFLTKKGFVKGEYYKEEIPIEKEVQILRKENKQLKKDFQSQAIDKFKSRRSIRNFSDKKIDSKTIYNIIEAGFTAPCAGNIQNTKIISIEDNDKKQECGRIAYQQYWVCQAPVLLVILRDDTQLVSTYPDRGKIYSIENTAAVVENILMAAQMYDLGACWVEAGDNEILREQLSIPPNLKIDAIIPIGYATKKEHKPPKALTTTMLSYEKYGKKTNKKTL